ncbi:DUF4199 domain-containing protein [Fodinibius salsisoli]|uniref:DUF4199 domain-containing protein n=1 Tax=Fodinibius salsisoli TaxID=2820877 RepID=A0ABT3PRY7_9BACT|nr:DUF4199 domain-containing protein [Fodinibius salsisoli]MCW9708596.1 DUF4199 domain-containing protein [Fodinibius salsisoli]
MEESQQQGFDNPQPDFSDQPNEPSYWKSVATAGVIFGIVAFVLSLVSSYAVINSEPTGSLLNPTQFIGTFACLAGSFGGMLAVWHYAREYDLFIQLGRGALIGFLTGVGITVVNVILGEAWQFIDPDMTQKVIESTIASIEAMELPEAQKQQIIDATAEGLQSQNSMFSQLLWSIPINGILNLITGMIGAKIFGQQEG